VGKPAAERFTGLGRSQSNAPPLKPALSLAIASPHHHFDDDADEFTDELVHNPWSDAPGAELEPIDTRPQTQMSWVGVPFDFSTLDSPFSNLDRSSGIQFYK
jgi:hypothetical protein